MNIISYFFDAISRDIWFVKIIAALLIHQTRINVSYSVTYYEYKKVYSDSEKFQYNG